MEPVSVGVFFKVRTTFVQLRPMTRWVALMVALPHKVSDPRISRKPIEAGDRWFHTINLHSPVDVDDVVEAWLTEAYEFEIASRGRNSGP